MTSKEISQKDEGKKEEEKKKNGAENRGQGREWWIVHHSVKKRVVLCVLQPPAGRRPPPCRNANPSFRKRNPPPRRPSNLKTSRVNCQASLRSSSLFFFFFFLFLSYSGSNREGVKKTSLPRYYALLEEEEARFLPRNYLSIHLTRPETLVPRKGVISPLEPDLDSSPLVSVLSFMARLPVTGFRPGLCVMPCFRQFEVCLRNTRTSSTCS